MTYKQAIQILKDLRQYDKNICEQDCKALDIAINVMENINLIRFNVFALGQLIEGGGGEEDE